MILIPLAAFLFSGFLLVVSAETSPIITNNKTEYVIPDGGLKKIYCETQGDPKPTIRWEINATGNLNFSVSKNASLVIRNHRMSERYGLVNVTCIANNTVGTVRKTFRVVLMKAVTITTNKKMYDVPDNGSSELDLNCEATGFPLPVISWSINGSILPEGLRVTYRDNRTKSLNFTVFNDGRLRILTSPTSKGFGMNVTCIANNSAGDERKAYLVRFLEAPMILTKSSNITITGDTASFLFINCETTGYPKPVVEWRFGKYRLKSSDKPVEGDAVIHYLNGKNVLTWSTYQVLSNGTIQIENPFSEKHVPYERFNCAANNSAGQDIRTHFLNFQPSVSYGFRAWFSKRVTNLEAIIRIKLNNATKPLKLFEFNITATNLTGGTADFTLVWAERDLQQYGKPRNVAALANEVNTTLNKGGNATLEKLIMFAKPAAPTGLVVDDKTASEISFSWKRPAFFDISLYNIQKNGANQKQIPGHKTSAILDGLDADTQYIIEVEPVSLGLGAGEPAELIVRTEVGPPVLTIVLVVVLVSAAILAMVLVIVYYRRRSKRTPFNEREDGTNPYEFSIPGVLPANIYTRGNRTICPTGISVDSSDKSFVSWNEIPRESVTIGDILGEGEFGLVQKASWLDKENNMEVQVAVKTVKDYATETDRKELFKELRLMANIDKHPNVVNLVGACSRAGPLWILVEFCENGNLLRYLKDNRKDNNDSASFTTALELVPRIRLAYDVSKGMHYLQDKKIIHRDLAARNVLLGRNKIAKVSDFGLSRDVYEVGIYTRKTGGKLPVKWMAIESLHDYSYNSKSDVWSFGVLLWEIETAGLVPYPTFRYEDLLRFLEMGGRLEKPTVTSSEIYEIMLTCWMSDPKERPDFKELESKLDGILMNMSDYLEMITEDDTNCPDSKASYVNYYCPSESDEEAALEQDSTL